MSEPDIYAHNYFKLPVRSQPVRAGDIVVLPDEPGGMTCLCDLNLETVQFSVAPAQTDRPSVPQTERRIPVACL